MVVEKETRTAQEMGDESERRTGVLGSIYIRDICVYAELSTHATRLRWKITYRLSPHLLKHAQWNE